MFVCFCVFCRAPFEGIYDMILLRNTIVKTGLDVGSMLQKETHPDVEENIIKSVST